LSKVGLEAHVSRTDHSLSAGKRRDDVLVALIGPAEAAIVLGEQHRQVEGRELIADRLRILS
jgi:hypothetical protein